jgi:uncharacterized protein YndB with AHSA1/START domain
MESESAAERCLSAWVDVPAARERVWAAWTTEAGALTFFAPACRIDLQPGGAYEMLFDLEAEAGLRGGEGVVLLAVQPMAMLSFTWNAPPELPVVRRQRTHVTVRFAAIDAAATRVRLTHDGWGSGEEWDRAYDYFARAWRLVVLPRLRFCFEHGPLDWDRLPENLQPAQQG